MALLAIRNSFHLGRIGHYAEQCARGGFASIHFVNVIDHAPLQAPYGGAEARFSTNPFCAALPGEDGAAVVLDMATSKIAIGKARVAKNKGVPAPEDSLLDAEGRPTRDPGVMFQEPRGALVAMGEHKGSGLAIMCELLAGALTGGRTAQPAHPQTGGIINNMLSVIIDPAVFGDRRRLLEEIAALIAYVKSARPRAGFDEVLVPGEPERRRRRAPGTRHRGGRAHLGRDSGRCADARDRRLADRSPDRLRHAMERVDCVVIGAGVIGLAVARQLAMSGREVLILEAAGMIGTETSSRNSEVIHAGIYYPTGSLKARTCVAGKRPSVRLLRGARRPARPLRQADRRHQRGAEGDAGGDPRQGGRERRRRPAVAGGGAVAALEPEVSCTAALLSPSTGIIDSHGLMLALLGDAEDHGALLAFHAPVARGRIAEDGIELEIGGAEPMALSARTVINSAGLHAPALARRFQGLKPELVPTPYFCKGTISRCPAHARSDT